MTPREEMELAAKAYGVQLHWKEGSCKGGPYESAFIERGGELVPWRPLEDDGDSRRLQVKLHLTTVFHPVLNQALCRPYWTKEMGAESREDVEKHQDPCRAMRLAVFRAAVALGKCLP